MFLHWEPQEFPFAKFRPLFFPETALVLSINLWARPAVRCQHVGLSAPSTGIRLHLEEACIRFRLSGESLNPGFPKRYSQVDCRVVRQERMGCRESGNDG